MQYMLRCDVNKLKDVTYYDNSVNKELGIERLVEHRRNDGTLVVP